jgi:hypothetical protein
LLRTACLVTALAALASLATVAVGCRPPTETSHAGGDLDAAGSALIHAEAPADDHHVYVDVALHGAAAGSYALAFSRRNPGRLAVAAGDPAVRCASAHGKECRLAGGPEAAELVAVAAVGPGGAGVLRAAFDTGRGGWFAIVRLDEGGPAVATPSGRFEIQLKSEALTRDETAHRFAIRVVEARPALTLHP